MPLRQLHSTNATGVEELGKRTLSGMTSKKSSSSRSVSALRVVLGVSET
jgi:hypothetical protein